MDKDIEVGPKCENKDCGQDFNNENTHLAVCLYGVFFLVGHEKGFIGFTCPRCLKTSLFGTSSHLILDAKKELTSRVEVLKERKRLGIAALALAAGLKEDLSIRDINFGLAPRINAAGRLEHASLAVNLLISKEAFDSIKLLLEEIFIHHHFCFIVTNRSRKISFSIDRIRVFSWINKRT